ncbi:hypothetical protein MSAN_00911500 [Mycena sanguinolenta]|uniref:Protein-S-isoprenylcysteine O-methyltransferase n=1 Tax=Mycena sanguinolenta TaxID=230812 RepID=A0A8H6YWK5_9AGAR|nr:hypothetical protein MSAN_00911500 [Mycena sanguinolenta]
MSFSKVLCIVAATTGLHVSTTSPNPPPLHSEKSIAPTGFEFMLASYPLRIALTCIYWGVAMAEIFVIMGLVSPSVWAEKILHAFALGGNPAKVIISATPTLTIGACLILCGAVIRLACYHELGRLFTFETGIFKNHKLVTSGPYSIVRHPSYLGAMVAYVGLMLYYASAGSWVMECAIKGSTTGRVFGGLYALLMFLVVTGLTCRIPKEDEALRNEFGKEWEDWAAGRYALLPFVY